mmetsp:Transcript_2206/g.2762  ORF Transcript_2206/g.2762 Transcript_2206/m.2762 type:complete len:80 (-) Transcript_2206:564-803(-)
MSAKALHNAGLQMEPWFLPLTEIEKDVPPVIEKVISVPLVDVDWVKDFDSKLSRLPDIFLKVAFGTREETASLKEVIIF